MSLARRVGAVAVAVAAVASAAGCRGGERIAECDALLGTVQKIAECGKLDRAQRTQLDQTAQSLDDALHRLAAVGADRAPAELVNEATQTCAKQDVEIRRLYEKVAPECLK